MLALTESSGPSVEVEAKNVADLPPAPAKDDLLREADVLGSQLRDLIVRAKRLPKDKSLEPHQDPIRALALAQANLQAGFMWLRKAIEQKREF